MTRLEAGRPRFGSGKGMKGIVTVFATASRPALGSTQPSIQLVLGVRWPEREAGHSPPSSAEVKMRGAIPPLPNTSSWRNA
jgi:hypothetical protein